MATSDIVTLAALEFVRSVLLPHMLPEHLERMAELPKTSAGTLDRQTRVRS